VDSSGCRNGNFSRAAEEQRIVLTFDLDFGEILALSGGRAGPVSLHPLSFDEAMRALLNVKPTTPKNKR
jgi:hypothetical protein